MMITLGTGIVMSGFAYACACRVSTNVTELGIKRGQRIALACLIIGIAVDMLAINP